MPALAAPVTGQLSLDAAIPPEAAGRLFRSFPLAALRNGRSRGTALEITWLDTAEGRLAAEGLALEQPRRGARRLLRSLPAPEAMWRPGMPAETLALLAPDESPEVAAGLPLQPLAAFTGGASRLALSNGVEAVLIRGSLRAAEAEVPAARLTLRGPPEAVLDTIKALAEEAPALPPRVSLAEEARALAQGAAPRPVRLGAPRLAAGLDVEAALMLALGHLTEALLWHAPAARTGATPEGVHQMRVAMRRMRSLLRVFRPACDGPSLRRFDQALKALASLLGPARDWDVWLGGLGAELAAALPEEPRIATLLREARARREAAYAALRPALDGPILRRIAWEAVALIETRPWRSEAPAEAEAKRARDLTDFAAAVLDRRWRRIEQAGERIAELPPAEFHALRIQAKRMRYAAELFLPLWGRKRGKRFLSRLADVQDAFGLANDAVVAHGLMTELAGRGGGEAMAWACGVAEGWALARARRARSRATSAWTRLLDNGNFWNR